LVVTQGSPFSYGPFVVLEPSAGAQLSGSLVNAPSWVTLNVQSSVNNLGQPSASVTLLASPGIDVPLGGYNFIFEAPLDGFPVYLPPIQITVQANQPPTLAPINNNQPFTVNEGTPLTFTAVGDPRDAGQTLTFSLQNAPAGAVIDPQTGVFTWTPAEVQGPG